MSIWIHDNFTNENGVSRLTVTKTAIAEWWRTIETNPDPVATLYMDASVYCREHLLDRPRYWIQAGRTGRRCWQGNSLTTAMEQGEVIANDLASPKEFTVDGKVLECGPNKCIYTGIKWPVPEAWPDATKVEITVRRVEEACASHC